MSEETIETYKEDDHGDPDVPSLTKSEVEFLIGMIEHVSKRGAFYPSEFTDVGIVYNRLKTIYDDYQCKHCDEVKAR